jgi:hypothetical protein
MFLKVHGTNIAKKILKNLIVSIRINYNLTLRKVCTEHFAMHTNSPQVEIRIKWLKSSQKNLTLIALFLMQQQG